MQPITILFDLDDTLIKTGEVYRNAVYDIISLLGVVGVPISNAHDRFVQIEEEYVKALGFQKERFPLSLVALYETLAKEAAIKIDPYVKEAVFSRAMKVYDHDHEIIFGAKDLLQALKISGYRLFLVTKGDNEVQRSKVKKAGLHHYFEEVVVLFDKTPKTWEFVALAYEIDPARSFVVGDSIRSDVNAAIGAGFNSVYIEPPHTWFIEVEEPHPKMITQRDLQSLVSFFKVEKALQEENEFRNNPESNLIRAALNNYTAMVPDAKLKNNMPDCPGSHYLFVFDQESMKFKEIHAVFYTSPENIEHEEVSRNAIIWSSDELTPDNIKKRHDILPEQLCNNCKKREDCVSKSILNGKKVFIDT